jgi:hypothetical protein
MMDMHMPRWFLILVATALVVIAISAAWAATTYWQESRACPTLEAYGKDPGLTPLNCLNSRP